MASQTIQLSAGDHFTDNVGGATRRGWSGLSVAIDTSLLQDSDDNSNLNLFAVAADRAVILDLSADLSNEFETSGGVDVTVDGTTYSFDLRGQDTSEPYWWYPTNSGDVNRIYSAIGVGTSATLVIRDVSAPDTTAPVFQIAVTDTNGLSLIVAYNERLDSAHVPAASAFDVQVAGVARTVTGVTVRNFDCSLVLSSAVAHGETLTVSYTQPADATTRLQDVAGNEVADLPATTVTNRVPAPPPDTGPPVLQSAATNATGTQIILTYDEAVKATTPPSTDSFSISPARAVEGLGLGDENLTLHIYPAFVAGDTITISYTPGDVPIQDVSGNNAAAFANQAVTNNVPAPNHQVFDLDADEYLVGGVSKRWLKTPRPLVNANLCPSGETRYLDLVVARREDDRGGVFHFEPVLTGTRTNGHDLSTQVETSGVFRISVGSTHFDFPVSSDSGGDEPYAIDFTGDTQTAFNAWRDANLPNTGTVAGTFTIWDGTDPNPLLRPPELVGAELQANGARIVLTFDEDLDLGSVPAVGDFTIVPSSTVTLVNVRQREVWLALNAIITDTSGITVGYTPGTNPIQDVDGNDAEAFSGVTVELPDTSAPILRFGATNPAGTVVTLEYAETLNDSIVPAATDFMFSPARTISDVDISGQLVLLTVSTAFAVSDAILLNYTPGTNPVQDEATNQAAALTNYSITNNVQDTVVPTLQSAITSIAGTIVTLTYDEVLDTNSVPAVGDFTFSPAKTISQVVVVGRSVAMQLSVAFAHEDTITLDYTAGTNPIQDVSGNDAADLSGESVANNVPDTTPPILQSIETDVAGTRVVLTYGEALDTSSVPVAGDFTLSPSRTITNVEITGANLAVVLTVSSAFLFDDMITLDYTAGTNPIEDDAGNAAVDLSGQSVTNNVPEGPPDLPTTGVMQIFDTPGAGTWVNPSSEELTVVVEMVGGGGGGAGLIAPNAGDGGDTTFGTVNAEGGSGGLNAQANGVGGAGGDGNIADGGSGESGTNGVQAGGTTGAASITELAGYGIGGVSHSLGGGGGGGGGYSRFRLRIAGGATVNYTVGSGGVLGGIQGTQGQPGVAGAIRVTFQPDDVNPIPVTFILPYASRGTGTFYFVQHRTASATIPSFYVDGNEPAYAHTFTGFDGSFQTTEGLTEINIYTDPNDQSGTQVDFIDELIEAKLELRSADGSTVYTSFILEDIDSTVTYQIPLPKAQVDAIFNAGTDALQLHFVTPFIEIEGVGTTAVGGSVSTATITEPTAVYVSGVGSTAVGGSADTVNRVGPTSVYASGVGSTAVRGSVATVTVVQPTAVMIAGVGSTAPGGSVATVNIVEPNAITISGAGATAVDGSVTTVGIVQPTAVYVSGVGTTAIGGSVTTLGRVQPTAITISGVGSTAVGGSVSSLVVDPIGRLFPHTGTLVKDGATWWNEPTGTIPATMTDVSGTQELQVRIRGAANSRRLRLRLSGGTTVSFANPVLAVARIALWNGTAAQDSAFLVDVALNSDPDGATLYDLPISNDEYDALNGAGNTLFYRLHIAAPVHMSGAGSTEVDGSVTTVGIVIPTAIRLAGIGSTPVRGSVTTLTVTAPTGLNISGVGSTAVGGSAQITVSDHMHPPIYITGAGATTVDGSVTTVNLSRVGQITLSGIGSTAIPGSVTTLNVVRHGHVPIYISGVGSTPVRGSITTLEVTDANFPFWPSHVVPSDFLSRGFTQVVTDAVVLSPVETGPARRRPRYTDQRVAMSGIVPMNDTQWNAFISFYSDELDGGAKRFYIFDPLTSTQYQLMQFVDTPSRTRRAGGWDVSMTFETSQEGV